MRLGRSVIARGVVARPFVFCIDQLTQGILIAVAKACRVERAGSSSMIVSVIATIRRRLVIRSGHKLSRANFVASR
jgi:hypothetical protein